MEYSVEILQFSIQTVLKTYLLRHFNTFKQVNKRERERRRRRRRRRHKWEHNSVILFSIPLLDRIEKEQPIQQNRSIGKNPGTGMDPAYSLEESNSILA